jgi:hypothetical protein
MSVYQEQDSRSSGITDTLETISYWRQDLSRRLELARLRYELGSTGSREKIIELGAEVADFNRVCSTLKAVIG